MQRSAPQPHPHQIARLQSKGLIGAVGERAAFTPSLEPDLNEVKRRVSWVAKA